MLVTEFNTHNMHYTKVAIAAWLQILEKYINNLYVKLLGSGQMKGQLWDTIFFLLNILYLYLIR